MAHRQSGGDGASIPTRWLKHDVTSAVLTAAQGIGFVPSDTAALIGTQVDPSEFYSAESFRRAYWSAEMFRKYPFDIPGVDRKENALKAFHQAEQRCARANQQLHDVFNRASVPDSIQRVLKRAKALLADLFDGFSVDEISAHARWGPGSTTSLPARFSTASNKWWLCRHITRTAVPYLDAFVAYSGWSLIQDPIEVEGNFVTTVPKNSKTDRTIAIEPDWNMFFQLGLGGAIRSRLQRRMRTLFDNAQEIQQALARKGSLTGDLATIDLSMASDSICLALVEELLPANVLQHVLALRSQYGSVDGGITWFPYEKVSSMGNGSTFELETALFLAIARAAGGHATAYGDDLVVPAASASWVITVLEWCGFLTNEKKTFTHGPFRESCGGHYFNGVDVTPLYIDEPLTDVTRLAKANQLREKISTQVLPELESVWAAMARGIPGLFCGPSDVDGVLHSPFDRARPRWNVRRQTHEGLRIMKVYDEGWSMQLGGLRAALFGRSPGKFSKGKLPGTPRVVVRQWYSDQYRPVPPAGQRELEPLRPRWKGTGALVTY